KYRQEPYLPDNAHGLYLASIKADSIKRLAKPSNGRVLDGILLQPKRWRKGKNRPASWLNQLAAGHLPVARCAWKSLEKSLSALSIGGPGIAMRLQKPLPLLKARIFPNCSRIGWPPCPC